MQSIPQSTADQRLFEQMRQAEDEKFFSRREWYPLEDRLKRQIRRNAAQIDENRRVLSETEIDEDSRLRHEEFEDGEWIRRGDF